MRLSSLFLSLAACGIVAAIPAALSAPNTDSEAGSGAVVGGVPGMAPPPPWLIFCSEQCIPDFKWCRKMDRTATVYAGRYVNPGYKVNNESQSFRTTQAYPTHIAEIYADFRLNLKGICRNFHDCDRCGTAWKTCHQPSAEAQGTDNETSSTEASGPGSLNQRDDEPEQTHNEAEKPDTNADPATGQEDIGMPPPPFFIWCADKCNTDLGWCREHYCRNGPSCDDLCKELVCRGTNDCNKCPGWSKCRKNSAEATEDGDSSQGLAIRDEMLIGR
ncbi:hypothetical protein K491DRAFT_783618 [Lophiostoma macrostomum CBS 122681]|uniref:Uncharacterized protein n=1 Tax=Lophiostoma macrostomum CBS 122681 TaxID=1314788 RepID=A0A6A6SRQ6_9PLEO|nr:hypothetical protein K491DRAFT_783618 [Lophiostoma macrostomum CBS 122681]